MLEVVFDEITRRIILKEFNKNLEKQTEGEVVGENFQDVICFGAVLDIGNINCDIGSQERMNEYARLFGHMKYTQEEVERYFARQREEFEHLLDTAKSGGHIRVWQCNMPFSTCAFAFLCDILRDIDCNIGVITLPEYWENKALFSCSHWGEIQPGQIYKFLPSEKQIISSEKQFYSNIWRGLKAENAPLRILLNGRLVSVPEDFYDHIIFINIPNGEFVIAQLIGNIYK